MEMNVEILTKQQMVVIDLTEDNTWLYIDYDLNWITCEGYMGVIDIINFPLPDVDNISHDVNGEEIHVGATVELVNYKECEVIEIDQTGHFWVMVDGEKDGVYSPGEIFLLSNPGD